jgi:hypothetical protein
VDLAIGIFIIVVGAALASWGAYRLLRPRRPADVEWIRRNPRSNRTLGGLLFGFDRGGAFASVALGVFAVFIGVAVIAAI